MNLRILIVFAILTTTMFTASVQCDVRGVTASPGETLSFSITITNDEDYERNVHLSYIAPEGFIGKFIYNGKDVEWLKLNDSESITIQFQLEVPQNAKEREYYVTVYALNSITFRINVEVPDEPLDIMPSITGVPIEAGDEVSFPITIENKLNAEYKVDLSCSIPKNWSYKFVENNIEVYKIILDAGERRGS